MNRGQLVDGETDSGSKVVGAVPGSGSRQAEWQCLLIPPAHGSGGVRGWPEGAGVVPGAARRGEGSW